MKSKIKNLIIVLLGLILSFNVGLYAWSGLQAETGDKLSLSKWNELASNVWGKNGLASYYAGGYVGIGTSSPGGGLNVLTNLDAGPNSPADGADLVIGDYSSYHLQFDGNEIHAMSGSNMFGALHLQADGGDLLIHSNIGGGKEFIIKHDGNVGIGTANPVQKLHVNGTTKLDSLDGTNILSLRNASDGGEWQFKLQGDGSTSNNFRLSNTDSGTTPFFIRSNGNIGIGTVTPGAKLSVIANNINDGIGIGSLNGNFFLIPNTGGGARNPMSQAGDRALIYQGNTIGNPGGGFTIAPRSTVASGLRIDSNGNVGIGISIPTVKLDVAGSIKTSGTYQTSDQRYKKDIKTIESPLDKISKLRGVTFNWRTGEFKDKNFPTGNQVGFIAQEVEKVIPQIVTTDDKGYKSVQYANMTAVLVEAVKELKNENEKLKEDNKIINEKLNKLFK